MTSVARVAEIVTAIDQVTAGMARLRDLKVTRSRKFLADYAEWLIAELFDGAVAPSKTQQHWDVKCNGFRVQVKSHWKAEDNPTRWSTVKGEFDVLVIVVFKSSLRLSELYWVPSADLKSVRRPDGSVRWNDLKSWSFDVSTLPTSSVLRPLLGD